MNEVDRRRFIAGMGAATGGLALGACANDGDGDATVRDESGGGLSSESATIANPLDTFDHVVVVMFENRSFDNLLGSLYGSPGKPQTGFDGIFVDGDPGTRSNPGPDGTGMVYATLTTEGVSPSVDPGECWADVNSTIFNTFAPPSNKGLGGCPTAKPPMTSPWNAPAGATASMEGFPLNYQANWGVVTGDDNPSADDVAQVMAYFDDTVVPVTHQLARSFGVFDAWHCDVPSDTFVNRSFFHAGSSTGIVTEPPYTPWVIDNTATTIFERFNQAGVTWKSYFDPWQIVPATLLINFRSLWDQVDKFHHFSAFLDDAKSGDLPQYSFIEPRLLTVDPTGHPETDMHPTFFKEFGRYVESDVRNGDILMHQIYDAVRTSPVRDKTLLMMVFDEHGGMHDHVAPPAATPPGGTPDRTYDFGFDRLGVRVPAIAISSHITEGTIVSDQMQNTSVIHTLEEKWSLDPLTPRDESAPTFEAVFNSEPVRDWPEIPAPAPAAAQGSTNEIANPLANAILASGEVAAGSFAELQAGGSPSADATTEPDVPEQLAVSELETRLRAVASKLGLPAGP